MPAGPRTSATLLLAMALAATGCSAPAAVPAVSGGAAASAPSAPADSPGAGSTAAKAAVAADSVEPLPADLRATMTGVSWRPGCPVALDDLRLVHVSYVDFDGTLRPGRLVVHKTIADATLRTFQRLRANGFPIRSMNLIDTYGGSDDDSMAADNTSGFNCRTVPGSTKWSNHAYGRAIDVNTVENPYLPRNTIMPPAGKAYLDRRDVRPGMIVAGDPTVRAFAAEGFTWGGAWKNGTDYQHFEHPA